VSGIPLGGTGAGPARTRGGKSGRRGRDAGPTPWPRAPGRAQPPRCPAGRAGLPRRAQPPRSPAGRAGLP